jgi:hypothetical protein
LRYLAEVAAIAVVIAALVGMVAPALHDVFGRPSGALTEGGQND